MRRIWLLLAVGALLVTAVGCDGAVDPLEPTSAVPTLDSGGGEASPTSVPGEIPTGEPTEAACRLATPYGEEAAGLPPITEDDHTRGPADAPVTLIEYADFQ
ncbi:MAG: hypothetical protein JXD18_11800 [Anaerolineae bacterium]|nr:hypothetical protein [Anaerolineae bacterium]